METWETRRYFTMFLELLNSFFNPKLATPPPVNMNLLTQSPGLHHLVETIFENLPYEDLLLKCQEVNGQWRRMARDPIVWLRKCEGLTNEKSVSKATTKLIVGCYNLYLADDLTQELMEFYQRFV